MVDFIELMIKNAEERGDYYKRCGCGAVHVWKKGMEAKFIPMLGQPCLMIIEESEKK